MEEFNLTVHKRFVLRQKVNSRLRASLPCVFVSKSLALGGVRAVFHRPHPGPETRRGMVRAVRDFLTGARARRSPKSNRPFATASMTTSPFRGARRAAGPALQRQDPASREPGDAPPATRARAAGMSLNQWIAHRIETGT